MKLLLRVALALFAGIRLQRFLRRMAYPLAGKTVLITGGSRGLGLELARQCGRAGARLVLVGRDAAALERAADELRQAGVPVATMAGDVSAAGCAKAAVSLALETFGRLDVLINNAGIILVGPLDTMALADYERALGTHLWGPLRFMEAARPHLKDTGGRIVNISSIGGKIAVPHLAAYSASKFALAGLSAAWKAELAKDGIRVTSVFPGLLRTGSHLQALFKGRRSDEFAWFTLGGATPLTSMASARAAAQILKATREGRPHLVLSLQAKLAVLGAAIFPNLAAEAAALADRFLPRSNGQRVALPGAAVRGSFPPASLTVLPDLASRANNERG